VVAVKPARAYTDGPLRLRIEGTGFVPTFRIDEASGLRRGNAGQFSGRVGSGTEPVLLHNFDWVDVNTLTATMDPGLPAGLHTVQVIDPRGQPAEKPKAFWSLGPDDDAPVLTVTKPTPDTPIGPGVVLDVDVSAVDPDPGTLDSLLVETWVAGQRLSLQPCPPEADPGRAHCVFQVTVPDTLAAGDQLLLYATARDRSASGNVVHQSITLTAEGAPVLTSINPTLGGIVGGTDVVIRGAGFHPGSQVYLGDLLLLPHGGTVLDEQTIVGRAPAHVAGAASVVVRTPIGSTKLADAFRYLPPPQIASISPEMGSPDGGTVIHVRGRGFTDQTQIFFGESLVSAERCEELQKLNDTEIVGRAPAGRGQTSVWAFDPDLGWTRLPDGFGWMVGP
jgi:hypothetical protein